MLGRSEYVILGGINHMVYMEKTPRLRARGSSAGDRGLRLTV